MTWRKWFGFILIALLPLLLIPSLTAADPSLDPPPLQKIPLALRVKIEPQVLKELASGEKTTYIVYLTPQADLAPARRIEAKLTRRQAVVSTLQAVAERSQREIRAYLDEQQASGHVEGYIPFWVFDGLAVSGDLETLLTLAARPEVEKVRANHTHQLPNPKFKAQTYSFQLPTSNLQSVEWNIARVGADRVWRELGATGRGTVVANMDTGVEWTHPALQSKYRGADGNHNYNWFDFTGTYPDAPDDGHNHGTHTMGTMVGDDGGDNQIGMAPGAQWIAVKVFDDLGRSDDVDIHRGFQWLLAPTDLNGQNPDPSKAPDVVSNSWGDMNGADLDVWPDVVAWRAAGILPVFAAGNEGEMGDGSVNSPASYPEAVAVGATDQSDSLASFSSLGPSFWEEVKPEVSAPGVDIRSSIPGGYSTSSGTSMATPHVAGLAALLLEADPTLTTDGLENFMKYTALDLGEPGPDNAYGWGRIDAYEAVRWALEAGKLYGQVTELNSKIQTSNFKGTPIPGARVSGVSQAGDRFVTTTDASGTYTVSVPGGFYDLTTSAFGYLSATVKDVEVSKGYMSMRDLILEPAPTGTLSGRVTEGGTGEPLAATIRAVGTPAWTVAEADGFYSLVLPVGSYTVEASMGGHRIERAMVSIAEGAVTSQDFTLPMAPSLLLVDADVWLGENVTLYYQYALDKAGYLYDTRLITDTGYIPTVEDLGAYDVVMWATPWQSPGYIGADEALMDYLDNGGRLLIAGQDIGYWDDYESYAPFFYTNYLHANFLGEPDILDELVGADILEGLILTFSDPYAYKDTGFCSNIFVCFYPDQIEPADGAASPIIAYPEGGIRGIKAESSPYRVVYFGFGLESVGPRDALAETVTQALTWLTLPSLTKTVDKEEAILGDLLTYTLTLHNISTTDLPGVSLADPIPEHTSYIPDSVTGGASYDPGLDRIHWSGTLSAMTQMTFTFQAAIEGPLAGGTVITNTATLDDGQGHTLQASAMTAVRGPDLTGSTKTVDKALALPGDVLTYTLTLRNSGPVTVTQASVVDPISEDTVYVADSATGGATYNEALDQIEWTGVVPGVSPGQEDYTWSDSDTAGGPAYEWVDITGIGTPITGLGDDTNVGPFPIGFSFPFYGNSFTTFHLCSNGFLSFTSTSKAYSNASLPSGTEPFNLIAPFWDDLTFTPGGAAYYWSNGQDTLVVSYIDVPHLGSGGPYTFQVILRTDGSITYQYRSMAEPWDEATIGIQNADGTQGLTIAHNQAYVHDGLAILISPPAPPIPPPIITFQVEIDEPLPTNTVITNTATLDDGQGQTLQRSAVTTVVGPDLTSSTKTVDKAVALAGDTLTYTLALRNTGVVTATQASLVDPIPEDTVYVDGSATGGATYNGALNQIEWTGTVPLERGYTWLDSDMPDGPIYNWLDITNIGTPITGLGDDTNVGPFPIGFSFPFYGNEFSTFRLCSNGFLSFTSTATAYSNVSLPRGAEPFNLIAPFWDDLTFSVSGEAYYWTDNQDTLVVSYINVPRYSDEEPYTFQVILRADGSITYQYRSMGEPLDEATVGIQNADGTQGLTIAHNQAYAHDGLAVLISPPSATSIAFQVRIAAPLPPETAITNTVLIDDGRGTTHERRATTRVNTIELEGSTKVVDKGLAVPGEVLTYTLTLRNSGVADATEVTVVDPIPSHTTYQMGSATGGATYDEAANRVLWSGALPSGGQVSFSFAVRADVPLIDGTVIENAALIDDGVHLPFTRTATTAIIAPDLSPSEKKVNSSLVSPGQILTYTILVKNKGSSTATVTLTDTLPAGVVYVPDSAWAGSGGPAVYDPASQQLTWSGPVPAKAMATVRFAVKAIGDSSITNRAILDDGTGNVIEKRVTSVGREHRLFFPLIMKAH